MEITYKIEEGVPVPPDKASYVLEGRLSDGRYIAVLVMTFSRGRIIVGGDGENEYDEFYCYENVFLATLAALAWEPAADRDPFGWVRHYPSGRRRPGGDETGEYVSD